MTVALLAPAEKTYDDRVLDLMQISRHIVHHNIPRGIDPEEALADAFAEIPRIIAKWDPSQGALSTLAYQRLRGAMIDGHRRRTKFDRHTGTARKPPLSIQALSTINSGDRWEAEPYEGWQPKGRTVIDDVEDKIYAEWVLDQLHATLDGLKNQRNAEVCRMYWFDQMSFRAVGEAVGITETRACQIVNSVRKTLRTIMKDAA